MANPSYLDDIQCGIEEIIDHLDEYNFARSGIETALSQANRFLKDDMQTRQNKAAIEAAILSLYLVLQDPGSSHSYRELARIKNEKFEFNGKIDSIQSSCADFHENVSIKVGTALLYMHYAVSHFPVAVFFASPFLLTTAVLSLVSLLLVGIATKFVSGVVGCFKKTIYEHEQVIALLESSGKVYVDLPKLRESNPLLPFLKNNIASNSKQEQPEVKHADSPFQHPGSIEKLQEFGDSKIRKGHQGRKVSFASS